MNGGLLNELALFAGCGGGILGGKLLGWRTVCAVEIDKYCQDRLIQRQEEGHLQFFPIWDDVRTFDGRPWKKSIDVLSAGFPCQPFSVAGKQLGSKDSRNLWNETARIIHQVGPSFCFLENVSNLLGFPDVGYIKYMDDYERRYTLRYFGTILRDLSEMGYNAEWGIVSAENAGALHKRARLWILAYSTSERMEGLRASGMQSTTIPIAEKISGRDGLRSRVEWWNSDPATSTESRVGRMD